MEVRDDNVSGQGSEKTAYSICVVEFSMKIFTGQNQIAQLAGLIHNLIIYTLIILSFSVTAAT